MPAPSRLPALRAQRALRSDGRAGGGEALRGRPHTHSAPASLILFFWGVLPFFGGVTRTLEKEEKKGGVSKCCWTGRGAR